MSNRNKKVVQMQKRNRGGMMDLAVKDIMDVSEEVTNQLEMKRGMMQTVLDTVEAGFVKYGLNVKLRLASDGFDFLFSDIHDYLDHDEDPFDPALGIYDFEDEDDDEPIEMFNGDDEDGNEYSIMVMLAQNEQDEDSFDLNIAVIRDNDGVPEIQTDNGWEPID